MTDSREPAPASASARALQALDDAPVVVAAQYWLDVRTRVIGALERGEKIDMKAPHWDLGAAETMLASALRMRQDEYAAALAAAAPPPSSDFGVASEQAGEFARGVEAAARDLVDLVEGVGCKRWEDGAGKRLKDTNEWARFYVAVCALAREPETTDSAARAKEEKS